MKGIMKKATAIFMAMVMVVSCMVVNGTTAEADGYTVNPAEYDIEYLLSNYQVYVKEDLTTTQQGHQVGSLVVGKDATLVNSFGDASIASSYLYNIKAFLSTNPFYSSVFSKPEYAGCENSRVYYTNKADNIYLHDSPKTFVQVDSYINFTDAFSSIQTESTLKANNGSDVQVVDGYIVLDMSAAGEKHTYTITEEQLKAAKAIRLKGTDGKSDVFRDLNNPLVISFEGCGDSDVTLKFDGSEGTVGEYSIGMQWDVNTDAAVDEYKGLTNDYSFKSWADSQEGGQVNPAGTRVIYNFPNATGTIHTAFLAGHLVAPNADVSITGGNYEGGVIAKSAYLDAEGHFYPYYEIGTASSEAPKSPSLSGKDFLITVTDAQTATEETVVGLAEGLHYEDLGAEGDATDVVVSNLSDLNKVTEPGEVTITLADGTDETVKATPVEVTATVVDEKASNTQWDGAKQAVYQLGANDFAMSIAQVQAYLDNPQNDSAATTLVKTLANATGLKDGVVDDISNIYIQNATQLKAEKGVYDVTFAYNNNQVTVQVTVQDDGPTDDESDKTAIPGVNLTANDFTVKGGSATLTPATFAAEDKANVIAKNLDGSSRNDVTIDATDLAALNEKIKNAEAGQYDVKVYSGGETTTVTVTVDTKHPYISADDFIIGVDEVGTTTPDSIKDLADAKKIQSETDTIGDDTKVTVDSTDATDLKTQTEPGLVQIAINDSSSDDDKAETRVVIATVVDETDETDENAANDLKIGANHFNISMEQAQAVVDAKNGSAADKEAADTMVKILANAVATANGDAVSRDDIVVDASAIQAADGSYDVTFAYTKGTDEVSVTVKATVKDNGPTDDDGDDSNGEEDPTAVPNINLTANDFVVEGGSNEISADTFKEDAYAKVEANYNEGPSIPDEDVTVDAADLAALNEMITGNVPGEYDVDVTVNGVTTTVTVTVTEKYPKLDANDFIISVDDAQNANDEKVKDLSDTNRYTSDDKENTGTSEGEDAVTVPDLSELTGITEPGSVDLTLEDGNTDKADSQEVTATVVDVTNTQTVGGKEIVIGANNYNISMEQAEAIVEALSNDNAIPDKAATDEMNKILANAVATEAGEPVDFDDITVDASKIKAENGSYDVTFTYNTVSVTVKATVKDAGSTDHYDDPTAVPSVNLTADDFTVAGGSEELDVDTFMEKAAVVAKNNDGSSRTDVTIHADELSALNEKIVAGEAGKYDVDVECGGVVTTVTVTVVVADSYPQIDANDFIISVDDAKELDDTSDDSAIDSIKDLSDTKRYETIEDAENNKETGTTDITISPEDIDKIAGVTEPGKVDVTLVDGNSDDPAADKTVTATVVDKTTTEVVDGKEVVIGANNYNMSVEQAQAVVDALANPSGTPSKTAADTMNKILANAVATVDGAAVNRNNITVDASNIKAENGTYDVTFTYGTGADAVSVTVQATVKDAGAGDGNADQTQVPDVNVTGNDFVVKVGDPEITPEDFMDDPDMADVDANYNDGASVPKDKITVNQDDLDKLNDAIKNGETGPVDVKVTADGETTTITVTVADEKTVDEDNDEVIAANDFEIKLSDYDTVVPSEDELIERAGALAYDSVTRADVEIAEATVKNPEKKAGEYEVTFKTAAGSEVTVTMTIDTTPSITANDFNISMEQATTIVAGQVNEDVMDMVKELANAVAKEDTTVQPDSEVAVDASKVKATKGSYDVTFTYGTGADAVSVTVKATVKDNSAADGDADKTDVPDVNLTANDFAVVAGSEPLTDKTFNDKADTVAKKNDGTPVRDVKVNADDLAKLNDAITNGKAGDYKVKVTSGDDTVTVTVTVTKGDDIKGVDQIYEISNPKDIPQDLADGRTVKTVNVNGKDIPNSAYTVKDGKMDINKSVFKDMKEGTYPVVITYTDGSKHTFNVKVIPYDETTVVKKVPTFHMQKDLGVGKTFKLNLVGMNKTAVKKFRSSNKKIATINENGVIKGKKKGKCKITATVIQNGSYYTVKIDLHVKKSMKMYNLKKAALQKKEGILPEFNVYKRVVKGKTTKLKFTNVEKDAKITYKSSNKKVATISKKGVIKGKKKGFAVVTAKIEQNGFTYYTKLIVRVDDGTKNKQLKKYLK